MIVGSVSTILVDLYAVLQQNTIASSWNLSLRMSCKSLSSGVKGQIREPYG